MGNLIDAKARYTLLHVEVLFTHEVGGCKIRDAISRGGKGTNASGQKANIVCLTIVLRSSLMLLHPPPLLLLPSKSRPIKGNHELVSKRGD